MPSRRVFAAPFVVTIAIGCGPTQKPAPDPEPAARPKYREDWDVQRIADDVCEANLQNLGPEYQCSDDPGTSCNPPIPTTVACPEGMEGSEIRVVRPYESRECFVVTPFDCTDDCVETPVACLEEVGDPRFEDGSDFE